MIVVKRSSKRYHAFDGSSLVRVKVSGNIVELMYSSSSCRGVQAVKRLSGDLYEDLRTGEVKEFKHIQNRSQDLQSVAQSLARLRDYINTNVVDVSCCRWVTLTYAENMTDPMRLKSDFKEFNRRHRKRVGHYEYITAAEPQGRGAWHLHVVMIFDHKAPFIPNADLAADWRQGFVKIKKLDNVDNVGAYLTAYLGDMELTQDTVDAVGLKGILGHEIKEIDVLQDDGHEVRKSYVKGARLCMYPPKFNIYRCSRGIKKPEVFVTTVERAKEKVSAATLTFEKTLHILDGNNFSRILNYQYYNLKRSR